MCSLTCMVLRLQDPSLRSSDALGPEDDEDDEDEWEAADERRRRAKATTVGQVSLIVWWCRSSRGHGERAVLEHRG